VVVVGVVPLEPLETTRFHRKYACFGSIDQF
jgi:hypothetical protein